MNDTTLIRSYRGLTRLTEPLLPLWVKRRVLKGKEDPSRQNERFGYASIERPTGKLVWLHGASVGECTMFLPIINRILQYYPTARILVTSGTITSAEVMKKRLPVRAFHQYVPLDSPSSVNRFLDHWQPDMVIWSESDIWPNLIQKTKARNIPMALINARMSGNSLEGWGKRQSSAKAIFGSFDKILAANEETANGLTWLLGHEIESSGNLKDAAPALPADEKQVNRFRKLIGARPVWCAASTHPGEDALILKAHRELLETVPDALLILAPRHPERREDVITDVRAAGFTCASHSKKGRIGAGTKVYLMDTIGDMGLAYRLAHISFVCGSLLKGLSGHNPLEPARLNNAVLTGAHISSFADTYMSMFVFNAAERILEPNMIGSRITHYFSTPDALQDLANQSQKFAAGRDAVLDYIWDELSPLFQLRFQ